MMHSVSASVNGVARADEVESRLLLAQYLRDVAGQTGTHIGCDTSQCGACTVLVDGQAVKSCTMFAVQAEGHEVETVESLATGPDLHPIQQAFIENHGLQCGYCTPGFLMAAKHLLDRNPDPSEDDIRAGLDGNLCRCTGYINIVKSVRAAAVALAQVPVTLRTTGA
jgi:aerobic carbon-monoxide dehydrogenase small subunit